jgi:hypothetical protein
VLDSVTVRGGRATEGGGVHISNSSPTVIRTVITENRASRDGSGIFVGGTSSARIYNNLITYNQNDGGDPHGVRSSAPRPSWSTTPSPAATATAFSSAGRRRPSS